MTGTLLSCNSVVQLVHEVMLLDAKAGTESYDQTSWMCSL